MQEAANLIVLRPVSVQLYHCRERKDWTEICTENNFLDKKTIKKKKFPNSNITCHGNLEKRREVDEENRGLSS